LLQSNLLLKKMATNVHGSQCPYHIAKFTFLFNFHAVLNHKANACSCLCIGWPFHGCLNQKQNYQLWDNHSDLVAVDGVWGLKKDFVTPYDSN
jgi:hypothetical protein